MSVRVLVPVYQKTVFILYNVNLLERRVYHGEMKIAYLFLKSGIWLIQN